MEISLIIKHKKIAFFSILYRVLLSHDAIKISLIFFRSSSKTASKNYEAFQQ